MEKEEYIRLVEQTELEEYRSWYRSLVKECANNISTSAPFAFEEVVNGVSQPGRILSIASRWNVTWQAIKVAVDSGEIKLSRKIEYGTSEGKNFIKNITVGISRQEVERLENDFPELHKQAELVYKNKEERRHDELRSDLYALNNLIVKVARKIHSDYVGIIENDKTINVHDSFNSFWGEAIKERETAKIFLKKYVLKEDEYIDTKTRKMLDFAIEKHVGPVASNVQKNVEIKLPTIATIIQRQDAKPKTTNAIIGNLKKQIQELTEGYEGAAKLAHAITVGGSQRGGNPWSEAEILNLEKKLGISLKGACLKAFKAGMPADLVKKNAGARPTSPREESPDDVES